MTQGNKGGFGGDNKGQQKGTYNPQDKQKNPPYGDKGDKGKGGY